MGERLDALDWIMWISVSLAANAASLMGALLMPFVIVGLNSLYIFKKKMFDRLILGIICCIPYAASIIDSLVLMGKI